MIFAPFITLDTVNALQAELQDYLRTHHQHPGLALDIARAGERPSPWHGQGMEAIDSRPYQAGDDIRHMDWRATARSGRPHSRVFQDERQRSLFLMIDLRPPMFFATQGGELKARRALRCATLLALASQVAHEPVAGVILHQDTLHYYPPSRHLDGIMALFMDRSSAAHPLDTCPGPWLGCLPQIDELMPNGATLILLSDLHETLDQEQAQLSALANRIARRPCQIIHIRDSAEEQIPAVGWIRVVADTGQPITINTHHKALRSKFAQRMQQHSHAISTNCHRYGITRCALNTQEPLLPRIGYLLA